MDELVTIITLTYNSKDLKPTIDSVLSQDYPNIQYIICDDCSTDLDLDYWSSYIDQHKRENLSELLVLRNETNLGTTRNMNKAYSHSKGKYIFNCSHDDAFSDASVISDWVNEFKTTKADIITAKRAVYEKGTERLLLYAPNNGVSKYFDKDSSFLFEQLAVKKNFVFGASTARTRDSLEKYGYCNEQYPFIEDYPMILKQARMGANIVFWDKVVIKYLLGGISSDTVKQSYLDEEESILVNEILPYTKNRKQVLAAHKRWLSLTKDKNKLLYAKTKYGSKSFKVLCRLLLMTINHPVYMFTKLTQATQTKAQ